MILFSGINKKVLRCCWSWRWKMMHNIQYDQFTANIYQKDWKQKSDSKIICLSSGFKYLIKEMFLLQWKTCFPISRVCLIMHSIIVIISGSTPSYSCQNGKSRMYVPQRVVIGDIQFQILQILSSLDKQYLLPIQDFRLHSSKQ